MGGVTGLVRTSGCEWLQYDYGPGLVPEEAPEPFTMWRYRHLLPMSGGPVRYSLPIGGPPLFPARTLRAALGTPSHWVKDETCGPTASNKERATALVIEDGLRHGLDTIRTASTGNSAFATAFGAAAAGMRASIFVSIACQEDKVALTQARAWVFRVPDGYAGAVDLSQAAVEEFAMVAVSDSVGEGRDDSIRSNLMPANGRTDRRWLHCQRARAAIQSHQFVPIWAMTEQTEE